MQTIKYTVLILLNSFIFSVSIFAQTEPAGYADGTNRFKKNYNNGNVDSIFNMFDATMQTALPMDKTRLVTQQLKTQLGNITTTEFKSLTNGVAIYKTTFTNGVFSLKIGFNGDNKITALLVQPYQEDKTNVVDAALVESPVTVNAAGASLSGSIITPKNTTGKMPVVLIIAGSGATDRNGNSAGLLTANSYFLLAEALGKAGIASLRYDKRSVAKSTSQQSEADLRFNDYVNDAIGFIKQLKTDSRFSKVIVLGHSEGSLIGMLAAARENADAYISLAGAGDEINKILAVQLKNEPSEQYKGDVARLDSLSKGLMVNTGTNALLFRQTVQPYLMSWMKYNPQQEIKKLKIPVLILQGTNDLQVSTENAQNLKKAKPGASLVFIEGMNHILKDAPADPQQNMATYVNPALPINIKLVDAVVQFINQLK